MFSAEYRSTPIAFPAVSEVDLSQVRSILQFEESGAGQAEVAEFAFRLSGATPWAVERSAAIPAIAVWPTGGDIVLSESFKSPLAFREPFRTQRSAACIR